LLSSLGASSATTSLSSFLQNLQSKLAAGKTTGNLVDTTA